ncbi:MAG: CapA family protein [Bacteroidales bacterium]|jgi:poly-gamma-glutamate synthesis protein (capsule biosynthesis protein)|nr:CapA family protein [Bacteroidales bacterium]MCI1785441.1 CapA family protein [Bacteroidales bacterium]
MKRILFLISVFISTILSAQSNKAGKILNNDINYESLTAGWNTKIRPVYYIPDTLSMIFIGDVMMHNPQIISAKKGGSYNFDTYFSHIKDMFSSADISVANMEFTLAGKPYTGYPSFSAPDPYPCYIADCGVNVFLTANNHILDKGEKGIARTIGIYDKMEKNGRIKYTGTALDKQSLDSIYPLIISKRGFRIAIVNFTYGTNVNIGKGFPAVCRTNPEEIREAIGKAEKDNADYIIAMPHWGTEYHLGHSESQAKEALQLAADGADIIIGGHPHVVQDTSNLKTGNKTVPVIYSMGNAVSNMSARNTRLELAVKINIIRDIYGNKTVSGPELVFLWCTLPGKLCNNYSVIRVKQFIGHRNEWMDPSDYDNMIDTYISVKKQTGLKD